MNRPNDYTCHALELRAAEYYAGIRKPEGEWHTIEDLAPQLAEFEHRVCAKDYDNACRILELIDLDYLLLWGHYDRLLALRECLQTHLTDPWLQARNLGRMGRVRRILGQFKTAITLYEQALTITRDIGDRQGEGECLGCLGISHRHLGYIETAIELYRQARAIADEIGNRQDVGYWQGNLGLSYHTLGQFERAAEHYEEALTTAREIADQRRVSIWLTHLGRVNYDLGDGHKAIALYEQAGTIAQAIHYRRRESVQLSLLGKAYIRLGQTDLALEPLQQSLAAAREIGTVLEASYALLALGRTSLLHGKLAAAQQYIEQATALDMLETKDQVVWVLGCVLLHQHNAVAGKTFSKAATHSQDLLSATKNSYKSRYTLAAALVGQAICDPRWIDSNQRRELLNPALTEYRRAIDITAAQGVVRDAIRDLELIRAAGIEGLEPVYEFLQNTQPKQ